MSLPATQETTLADKLAQLPGPILVLGASGFIGANLFRQLHSVRKDIHGTFSHRSLWRLSDLDPSQLHETDLSQDDEMKRLLETVQPRLIVNATAYGGYPFQEKTKNILESNTYVPAIALEILHQLHSRCLFVQLGSSSEYGDNNYFATSDTPPKFDSIYGVTKHCAAHFIEYYGKRLQYPCVNLRLFSVYGPWEEPSRLIPQLIQEGLKRRLPKLANPSNVRDFIFVDDVVEAIADSALNLKPEYYGSSFNIGTGEETSLKQLSQWSKETFNIDDKPEFGSYPERAWEKPHWVAKTQVTQEALRWKPRYELKQGLEITRQWHESQLKVFSSEPAQRKTLAIIIACYQNAQGLEELHARITSAMNGSNYSFQIVFVNDASPDHTEAEIIRLSSVDSRVIGVTLSRNFGSQAAFLAGMSSVETDGYLLMDDDLQDPPELIPQLIEKWNEGADVVYGARVSRRENSILSGLRKRFYRLLNWLSDFPIPLDAGDFSLMDRKVAKQILDLPESSPYIRGLRAYVGFNQKEVAYHRPARKHGASHHTLLSNFRWAFHCLLSLTSKASLVIGKFSLLSSLITLGIVVYFWTTSKPPLLWAIVLIPSLVFNFLCISFLALRNDQLFHETKARPRFILRHRIHKGKVTKIE